MQEEEPSTAKKHQTRASFCAEIFILEPGSIRKGADLEVGVKIALVELCEHEFLFDSICCMYKWELLSFRLREAREPVKCMCLRPLFSCRPTCSIIFGLRAIYMATLQACILPDEQGPSTGGARCELGGRGHDGS